MAAGLLVAVVAVQLVTGAFQSELGNDSDEAPHFMNGLLVRDYLRTGLGESPLRFAERYYISYPKIAPLMWPPLFHVTLGLFLMPGWPPHGAAIVLIAIFIAWTAWRLYKMARIVGSTATGVVVAALFVLAPDVVRSAHSVMLDIVVAAFAVESCYWLALYLDDNDWRHAVAFGVAAACACLTKANGVAVIFMPPILALLSRRAELVWRRGLFAAAGIVLVFAAPFIVIAYRLDSAIGDFGMIDSGQVVQRVALYSKYLRDQMGIVPLALALGGLFIACRSPRSRAPDPARSMRQALAALAIAACGFHLLNPHQMAAGRYLLLALAPLFALSGSAIESAVSWVGSPRSEHTVRAALLAVIVLAFLAARPAFAAVSPLGFTAALDRVEAQGGLAGRRLLVVSDEYGEGAFVSAAAIRNAKPAPIVIRGTKLLASGDWMDHEFQLAFASAAGVERELEDLHVDYVVVDRSVESRRQRFSPQVDDMLKQYADRFVALGAKDPLQPVRATRNIEVYRLTRWTPGPAKRVRVSLKYSLGRTVE